MGLQQFFANTSLITYGRAIRSAPRNVILSPVLLISALIYASAGIVLTWDQGAGASVPSLKGFSDQFSIKSGSNAESVRSFVALVYIGDAIGAGLSFFLNDRVGRRWAYRCYTAVWISGYITLVSSRTVTGLYASRIIAGIGIGALSVSSPMSIIEIAPPEIRGLLGAWYTVCQGLGLMTSNFCIYGIQLHVAASRLQYQIAYCAPIIFMSTLVVASFFIPESPRWLILADRHDDAKAALVRLRRLPEDHPRVEDEMREIVESLRGETELNNHSLSSFHSIGVIVRETFTTKANLRRLQQVLVLYALPQLSGGNSFTNYFIPILKIVGAYESSTHGLLLNGLYGMSKFFFSLIVSFFLIDVVGRRGSLLLGISIQLSANIYLSVYTKLQQDGRSTPLAANGALAFMFIQAFGYTSGKNLYPTL
ncbi:uncharacterized protein CTRU02_200984 [Colletotrichum truncatum]|uniref:Uncharacterized protein n=1 Tax=Colletotrichum truncatum TaxID=5467 RepID=A0ACC3ZGM0_COLTU|nr:uncharacterized protein CTRU02_00752 [Colletotrichum truncatum]KAF6802003.1 hypothetical protein CTRU02_00752 [Colletotrichum truncatum]